MKLIDIENMTADQIKAQRSECIADAAKGDVAELAMRFVDARYDAKRRDERLGPMGAEIKLLKTELKAAVEALATTVKERDELAADNQRLTSQAEGTEKRVKAGRKQLQSALRSASVFAATVDKVQKITAAATKAEKCSDELVMIHAAVMQAYKSVAESDTEGGEG